MDKINEITEAVIAGRAKVTTSAEMSLEKIHELRNNANREWMVISK